MKFWFWNYNRVERLIDGLQFYLEDMGTSGTRVGVDLESVAVRNMLITYRQRSGGLGMLRELWFSARGCWLLRVLLLGFVLRVCKEIQFEFDLVRVGEHPRFPVKGAPLHALMSGGRCDDEF